MTWMTNVQMCFYKYTMFVAVVFWRLAGLHLLPPSLWCVFLSDASGHGSQSTKVINASRSTLLSLGVMVGVSAVTATTWSLSCSTSAEPPDLQCSNPCCLSLLSLIPAFSATPKGILKNLADDFQNIFFYLGEMPGYFEDMNGSVSHMLISSLFPLWIDVLCSGFLLQA